MSLTFEVKNVLPVKIDYEFYEKPSANKFVQGSRVECTILTNRSLRVLFGILVATEEVTEKNFPKIKVLVEHSAEIEIPEDLNFGLSLVDIPLVGNYVGIIYPFARERITSLLAAVGVNLVIPPMNAIEHIKQNAANPAFKVVDLRKTNKATSQNSL